MPRRTKGLYNTVIQFSFFNNSRKLSTSSSVSHSLYLFCVLFCCWHPFFIYDFDALFNQNLHELTGDGRCSRMLVPYHAGADSACTLEKKRGDHNKNHDMSSTSTSCNMNEGCNFSMKCEPERVRAENLSVTWFLLACWRSAWSEATFCTIHTIHDTPQRDSLHWIGSDAFFTYKSNKLLY